MKFDLKIELNKTQKMIFLMAFIIISSISIFWLLVYNPARREMVRLKEDLSALQSEIEVIERVSGGLENLDSAYEEFYKRYSELEKMIPNEERSALGLLSSEADRMNIDVIAIRPGKADVSTIADKIEGKTIFEMPISLTLRCDYVTLGEYLNVLREKLPNLIMVDVIKLSRPEEEDAEYLEVLLDVVLYLTNE